jgi:hypothetical protein
MRGIRVAMVAILAGSLLASVPAYANSSDVIKRGTCSNASTYKLKLSAENSRIETDFEVDSNVVGQTWNVKLSDNGTQFFSGSRVTKAPSGSFEVRKLTRNRAGADNITARATNPATGEVCSASATF